MLFTDWNSLFLGGDLCNDVCFCLQFFLTLLNVQLTIENLKATVFRFVLAQTRKIILTLDQDFLHLRKTILSCSVELIKVWRDCLKKQIQIKLTRGFFKTLIAALNGDWYLFR